MTLQIVESKVLLYVATNVRLVNSDHSLHLHFEHAFRPAFHIGSIDLRTGMFGLETFEDKKQRISVMLYRAMTDSRNGFTSSTRSIVRSQRGWYGVRQLTKPYLEDGRELF